MSFREYASHDGLGLAELVAKGEITASELVEQACPLDRPETAGLGLTSRPGESTNTEFQRMEASR